MSLVTPSPFAPKSRTFKADDPADDFPGFPVFRDLAGFDDLVGELVDDLVVRLTNKLVGELTGKLVAVDKLVGWFTGALVGKSAVTGKLVKELVVKLTGELVEESVGGLTNELVSGGPAAAMKVKPSSSAINFFM